MTIIATKSNIVFKGSGDAVTNTISYSKDRTADDEEDDDDVCFFLILQFTIFLDNLLILYFKRVDFNVKEKVTLNFSIKYVCFFIFFSSTFSIFL